jgi:hypothetical protein
MMWPWLSFRPLNDFRIPTLFSGGPGGAALPFIRISFSGGPAGSALPLSAPPWAVWKFHIPQCRAAFHRLSPS